MLSHEQRRARRATLRSYGLSRDSDLTSLREIVVLAMRMCGVSQGSISLFDEQNQWFVVREGMEIQELPLGETICHRVIEPSGVTVVEDTSKDSRTVDLDICHGGKVGFYAAAPLLTGSGRIFGTLAVMDPTPRSVTEDHISMLGVLSRQVMAQLELRRALRRADVMRREVDHRVKNSLQSVASLTRLQSRRVATPEAREALEVVSRRIDTVAALNSELYRTGTDRKIGLRPFLSSVVDLIRASAPERVTISLDCADVNISAQHAGSLAIVVNEFTTNSFKHAFPDDREGHIEIVGRQTEPGTFRLSCRDDGVGATDPGAGLGLAIIDSAVESLSGEIERDIDGSGYAITVEFGI